MNRAYIIVVGNQGAGKSVWTKKYVSSDDRLFVFDPTGSYAVDYDFEDTIDGVLDKKISKFRIGTTEPEDAELFGDAAFGTGKCTFVVEECGLLFKRGEIIEPWARRLIFMGRHPEVNIIFVAQRASSIPIDIRSQANRVISFRQTNSDDVRALKEVFGKEFSAELSTFPDLRCLDWELGTINKYDLTIDGESRKSSSEAENTLNDTESETESETEED